MIVRTVDGPFQLIRQREHATLAAELAREWGNARFPAPQPRDETLEGILHHDAGWEPLDDRPRVDPETGRPATALELRAEERVRAWRDSIERARKSSPFSGLLVSLHVSSRLESALDRANEDEIGLLNQFQKEQQALQARLRDRLALGEKGGRPAVGKDGSQITEEALQAAVQLLKVCDRIALFLVSDPLDEERVEYGTGEEDSPPVSLRLSWYNPLTLEVQPWPFRKDLFVLSVPAVEIPAGQYESDESLRAAFNVGKRLSLRFAVQKTG